MKAFFLSAFKSNDEGEEVLTASAIVFDNARNAEHQAEVFAVLFPDADRISCIPHDIVPGKSHICNGKFYGFPVSMSRSTFAVGLDLKRQRARNLKRATAVTEEART